MAIEIEMSVLKKKLENDLSNSKERDFRVSVDLNATKPEISDIIEIPREATTGSPEKFFHLIDYFDCDNNVFKGDVKRELLNLYYNWLKAFVKEPETVHSIFMRLLQRKALTKDTIQIVIHYSKTNLDALEQFINIALSLKNPKEAILKYCTIIGTPVQDISELLLSYFKKQPHDILWVWANKNLDLIFSIYSCGIYRLLDAFIAKEISNEEIDSGILSLITAINYDTLESFEELRKHFIFSNQEILGIIALASKEKSPQVANRMISTHQSNVSGYIFFMIPFKNALLSHPKHRENLVDAFLCLNKKVYQKAIFIEYIASNPEHAVSIAESIKTLVDAGMISHKNKLLQRVSSTGRHAHRIAKILTKLNSIDISTEEKELAMEFILDEPQHTGYLSRVLRSFQGGSKESFHELTSLMPVMRHKA